MSALDRFYCILNWVQWFRWDAIEFLKNLIDLRYQFAIFVKWWQNKRVEWSILIVPKKRRYSSQSYDYFLVMLLLLKNVTSKKKKFHKNDRLNRVCGDKWQVTEYNVVGKLENNLQLVRIVSDISARIMLKKSSFLFVCKIIIMFRKNENSCIQFFQL